MSAGAWEFKYQSRKQVLSFNQMIIVGRQALFHNYNLQNMY